MKKCSLIVLLAILVYSIHPAYAQQQVITASSFIQGYQHDIAGEVLSYHSCIPEATSSLLIRCLNDKDFIEWETDSFTMGKKQDSLSFCWLGGYSTGTSKAVHQFHLYVDDEEYLSFTTYPQSKAGDWRVMGKNGSSLGFRYGSMDGVNDFFGYFTLKLPKSLLAGKRKLKLKVMGDASGSRDWYMTMRYRMIPSLNVMPEAALIKVQGAQPYQRIKVNVVHFGHPDSVQLTVDGSMISKVAVGYGFNTYILPVVPVKTAVTKTLKLSGSQFSDQKSFSLRPVRPVTVCLLAHSHTDIGYTELQTEVEKKQAQNVRDAITLVAATRDMPGDARLKWNIEVLWGLEAFLKTATEAEKKALVKVVKAGDIDLCGTYANLMTGLCRPEELYHLFDLKNKIEKELGVEIFSAMISDIPGYVWGLVPAMAQNGIRYFSSGPNPFDRIGHTLTAWGDKPFYWVSPSGKDTLLHWAAGSGYALFHQGGLGKDDGSRLLNYLAKADSSGYPYDMVQVRYTVGGDNGGIDTGLCAFVQRWNEKYASPKIRICTVTEMFKEFEKKYGSKLPVYSGDLSPYWEDGAGSTARETALSRNAADRLVEAEKLWSLFAPAEFPATRFDEAWKNVLLFSEHTWGAWNSISDPDLDFVKGQWAIKKSFADRADSLSALLYGEIVNKTFSARPGQKKFRVYNTGGTLVTDLVAIPAGISVSAANALKDDVGIIIPFQSLANKKNVFLASGVPAFGYREYEVVVEKGISDASVFISNQQIKNEFLSLRISPQSGDIISLHDSATHAEWVDYSGSQGLNAFIYTGKDAENPRHGGPCRISIAEQGPVVSTLRIESDAPGCKSLVREVSLYRGIPRVDIVNVIDKLAIREKESIRFAFPFSIQNPKTFLDYAWTALRPEADQLAGSNKNYFSILDRVLVTNGKKSACLYSPDAPFVELGGMTAERWMQGPVNVSWLTKTQSSALVYSWAMNNSWHTNFKAEQEGKHIFRYSITPALNPGISASTYFAQARSAKLFVCGRNDINPALQSFLQKLSIEDIDISSIIPDEGGKSFLVRVFNPSETEKCLLTMDTNGKTAGQKLTYFARSHQELEITKSLTLAPREIVLLRWRER